MLRATPMIGLAMAIQLLTCAHAGKPHSAPGNAVRQSVGALAEDPELTTREAARLLAAEGPHGFADCDHNGVPDSLDILAGRLPDTNHNFQDDFCDDVRTVRDSASTESWKGIACLPDTFYFSAYHLPSHRIWIRYTVPAHGAHLTLRALHGDRPVATIRRAFETCGAQELVWQPKNDLGQALPGSTPYTIEIREEGIVRRSEVYWKDSLRDGAH